MSNQNGDFTFQVGWRILIVVPMWLIFLFPLAYLFNLFGWDGETAERYCKGLALVPGVALSAALLASYFSSGDF